MCFLQINGKPSLNDVAGKKRCTEDWGLVWQHPCMVIMLRSNRCVPIVAFQSLRSNRSVPIVAFQSLRCKFVNAFKF